MQRRLFWGILFLLPFSASAVVRLDLNGVWNLESSEGIVTEARVPGSVVEALLNSALIPDPYYGTNENNEKVRSVFDQNWTFSRSFTVPASFFKEGSDLYLVFDSIDTVADVYLNGKQIGSAKNMFRRYRFPVEKELLKAGANTVSVIIYSPVQAAREAADSHGMSLMPLFASGIVEGIPFIRKSWFSYGWDWGIALPDSGLNQSVAMEAVEGARLVSVPLQTKIDFKEGGAAPRALSAVVSCLAEIEGSAEGTFLRLSVEGHGFRQTVTEDSRKEIQIRIPDPKLWYTHDLGTPERYCVKAELLRNGIVIDSRSFLTGIREIRLVREKDRYGESFYFELNRIPLFARGGNWIPCDTLIPRGVRSGLIEDRLRDCLAMNYNMIRVWGGGIYEDERFYNFCDANGILIWQDFPFACYATPHEQSFYDNVSEEVKDQLRRLVNHPSLALLCGNNEIEKGWIEWGYSLFFPKAKPGYTRLFEQLLPSLTARYAPQIPYWPSSPSAGGGFKKTCDPRYGDSHNWGVWHGGKDYTSYRKYPARFMSEFGFQSFPDMKTIRQFAPPEEVSFNSATMKVHQKNWAGNGLILSYMRREFSDPGDFSKQTVLSQLTQALAMECGIDYWRARRNNEQCMGALYWQMNDTWPTASWSAVDYYGRKKALYYFSKRFFSPVTAAVLENGTRYEVSLVNDTPAEATVIFSWKISDGSGQISDCGEVEQKLLPVSSVFILNGRVPLSKKNDSIFFWSLTDKDGTLIGRGMKLFGKAGKLDLKNPRLHISDLQRQNNEWLVTVSAEETALFVHFDADFDFNVSDNFFSLAKGESLTIRVLPKQSMTDHELAAGLRLRSLADLK